jgi:hypothetical protein
MTDATVEVTQFPNVSLNREIEVMLLAIFEQLMEMVERV